MFEYRYMTDTGIKHIDKIFFMQIFETEDNQDFLHFEYFRSVNITIRQLIW
jgi:hypothetical protein